MAYITETADATGSAATTYSMGVGDYFIGNLTIGATQSDFVRVNLVAGQTYTFSMTSGAPLSGGVDDPFLQLIGPGGGAVVVTNDDGGPGIYSTITYTAAATGAYYINAGEFTGNDTGRYLLSFSQGNLASYDHMMAAAALYESDLSWSPTTGTAANISFAFRTAGPAYTSDNVPTAFYQLSAPQKAAVLTALSLYSDVANLTFTQVNPSGTSNNATILFGAYNAPTDPAGAYAYFPGSTSATDSAGDVWLNNDSISTTSVPVGDYSFFAIIHELGHAMGLSHPGDYNAGTGVITYANSAQFVQDSHQYSIMSYFDESDTGANFESYPDTLMLYDVYALHQLYGANNATRATNSVYGFNSNLGANSVFNFAFNIDPALCIWDGGGIDKIDCSGFVMAQVISLIEGTFSNVGGFIANISIAFGAVIENATGGTGADFITGNSASNTLDGRGGADTLRGLGGNDYYYVDSLSDRVDEAVAGSDGYDTIRSAVSIDLNSANYTGDIETVVLIGTSIINATGDSLNNALVGNSAANILNGLGGADILRGLGGNDVYGVDSIGDRVDEAVTGSTGIDTIRSTISIDLNAVNYTGDIEAVTLLGAAAINATGDGLNNVLVGNAAANLLNGLGGTDTLRGLGGNDVYVIDSSGDRIDEAFAGSDGLDTVRSTISVNLNSGYYTGDIENVVLEGTAAINAFGDGLNNVLVGNSAINTLDGYGGSDTLRGLAGNDVYVVDSVLDRVDEAFAGSNGVDTIRSTISINLTAATYTGSVENVVLAGVNVLNATGNSLTNTLVGNSGANVLDGLSGADILLGGLGADVFRFSTALGASNIDRMADFAHLSDEIQLENAIFTSLAAGNLAGNNFHLTSAGAQDADDYIVYNQTTGELFYDANANGVGSSVLFARAVAGTIMSEADFFVI